MNLTDRLKEKLGAISSAGKIFDFQIIDRVHDNAESARSYISLFKSDGGKWETEISLPIINDSWEGNDLSTEKFLRNFAIALLKKFEIKRIDGDVLPLENIEVSSSIPSDYTGAFTEFGKRVNNANKSIIVIDDEAKIGKTLFMKSYCNSLTHGRLVEKVWWLDFNGGVTDVSRFLVDLFLYDYNDRTSYIVLDNIECCGLYNGQKIVEFLSEFVTQINKKQPYFKLIIIQDINSKIFENSPESTYICRSPVSHALERGGLLETIKSGLYSAICKDIKALIETDDLPCDNKRANIIKTFLVNIIYFSKYGVRLKIDMNNSLDKSDILLLKDKVGGIKLSGNGEIISFSGEICEKLLRDFKEDFIKILSEFGSVLCGKDGADYNEDVFQCYYKYCLNNRMPISIIDFSSILNHVDFTSEDIENFKSILDIAKVFDSEIAEIVLNPADKKRSPYFNNHVGSIMFAMETLAVYSKRDLESLRAWSKLHRHIVDTFNIDKDDIFAVPYNYDTDKTLLDFKDPKNLRPKINCIYNQIRLHDEVLNQCQNNGVKTLAAEDLDIIFSAAEFDDKLFNFFISPLQKSTEPNIDVDKFYHTYLLALLFEIEATAPDEQLDEVRIEKLWKKVKANCIEAKSKNFCYFYPARIPWVTARMALALITFADRLPTSCIAHDINNLKSKIVKYLINCSVTFTRGDKKYRFWSSGTGFWNSAMETTITCVSVLQRMPENSEGDVDAAVTEGIAFINLFKDKWFNDDVVADGVWAYEITESITKFNACEKLAQFYGKIKDVNVIRQDEVDKNDKSLGFSHIAKTFIDVVKNFVEATPDLLSGAARRGNAKTAHDRENKPADAEISLAAEELKVKISEAVNALENYKILHSSDRYAEARGRAADAFLARLSGMLSGLGAANANDVKSEFYALVGEVKRDLNIEIEAV